MSTDLTKVTYEEVAKFRSQLADYPEALADLDVIEHCEGNLEQAARVLARRAGMEEVKSSTKNWNLALQKAHEIVCDEKFKKGLIPGLIGGLIGALSSSGGPLLAAVATPTSIYIVQVGIDSFCQAKQSNLEG